MTVNEYISQLPVEHQDAVLDILELETENPEDIFILLKTYLIGIDVKYVDNQFAWNLYKEALC